MVISLFANKRSKNVNETFLSTKQFVKVEKLYCTNAKHKTSFNSYFKLI